MKKTFIILCLMTVSPLTYAQVGINTPNPQGILHVDGAKDNPATGAPTVAQQANDFVVTSLGSVGIGVAVPQKKVDINARNNVGNTDALRIDGLLNSGVGYNTDGSMRVLSYNNENGYVTHMPIRYSVSTGVLSPNQSITITDPSNGINGNFLIRSFENNGIAGANISVSFNYARGGISVLGVACDTTTEPTVTRAPSVGVGRAEYTIVAGQYNLTVSKPTINQVTITNNNTANRGYTIIFERLL